MDTNQQIIALFEDKISNCYQEAKQVFLTASNYYPICDLEIKTNHLEYYFLFLENSLKKPYNRITALYYFIMNTEEVLQNEKMYPLFRLKPKARKSFEEIYRKACYLVQGLDQSKIDPEFEIVQKEDHVSKARAYE